MPGSREGGGQAGATPTVPRSEPASASAPASTALHSFYPFDSSGKLVADLHVSTALSGSCTGTSLAVDAPGTFRCTSGSALYDPCFSAEPGSAPVLVVCVADPWTTSVVSLSVTGVIPAQSQPAQDPLTRPWAIELANGGRCVLDTGSASSVGDTVFVYRCLPLTAPPGSPAVDAVASSVDESSEPWTVRYQPSQANPVVVTMAVTSAWD